MKLAEVLLRDDRASQPLASAVPEGTLYYVTDEAVTEQSRASAWVSYSDAGSPPPAAIDQLTGDVTAGPGGGSEVATVKAAIKTQQIGITVDGAGVAITTGLKGFKSFPVAGTIIGVRMLADQVGSAVVDVWKDTYANYPPAVADTITAAAKPTISGANKSEDNTLTGWTVAVAAGDVFGFNVDSAATITRLTLELTILVT